MDEVKQQIESGGESADIDVDLRLTVLKPLHTVWLVDLYNHLSSLVGVGHIAKGWEKAGISGLLDVQTDLPPEDSFTDIELALEIDWRPNNFMAMVHKLWSNSRLQCKYVL